MVFSWAGCHNRSDRCGRSVRLVVGRIPAVDLQTSPGGARVILGASRGMPDSRYQRPWPFIPNRGFLGTAWLVGSW
jgi:hypothetical protein